MQNIICDYLTKGAMENIQKIMLEHEVYIISGGFLEVIYPVAEKLGIKKEHCYANTFIYNGERVSGYDTSNPLSDNGGKIKIVEQIMQNKHYNKIYMVGDGYTDLEVAKSNSNIIFCGFGEHVVRKSVLEQSENFFYNFQDLADFILQK